MVIIRSSVREGALKSILIRGTMLGGTGTFLLVLGGLYIPPEYLQAIGLPLIVVGFILITIGLLPFKGMQKLQHYPLELIIEGGHITLKEGLAILFEFDKEDIASCTYFEDKERYGILVTLKNNQERFFPYFSKRGFEQFKEVLS